MTHFEEHQSMPIDAADALLNYLLNALLIATKKANAASNACIAAFYVKKNATDHETECIAAFHVKKNATDREMMLHNISMHTIAAAQAESVAASIAYCNAKVIDKCAIEAEYRAHDAYKAYKAIVDDSIV